MNTETIKIAAALFIPILLCVVILVALDVLDVEADSLVAVKSGQDLPTTQCTGDFALCAAATCVTTGRMMKVISPDSPTGYKEFPEVNCTCPILNGTATAQFNSGNMGDTCDVPRKGTVWSLYQPNLFQPQEMNSWKRTPTAMYSPPQACPSELNDGLKTVNCFSFECEIIESVNGVRLASCKCPLAESGKGNYTRPDWRFLTQSGQGDKSYCEKHVIAAAFPAVTVAALEIQKQNLLNIIEWNN